MKYNLHFYQLWLTLLTCFLLANSLYAFNISQTDSLKGTITDVIEKSDSQDVNNVYLKLNSVDDETYYIDDYHITYLLEYSHSIIFSEYIDKNIPQKNICVKFEDPEIERRKVNEEEANVIVRAEKIFPNYPVSKQSFTYSNFNPGCPEADYHHRYIEVPVSYAHPEWGKFKLYYELNSSFDENKPTIIVPTDGQRTFSQVGWADKYKENFETSFNVVTYEYRGMFCSDIPGFQTPNRDWYKVYESLNSDNVIEDIERIRQDLLGDEKVYILGGSGTAMMGLKYLSKYDDKVEKAYLMSFFKDAEGSSTSGVKYFNNFLKEHDLQNTFANIREENPADIKQLLFLIQRLLYYDQSIAKELIVEVNNGKMDLFNKYTEMLGTVDYFIKSAQKYKPWAVVFMYETNIKTSEEGEPDINYPFLKEAEPLNKLAEEGKIPKEKFDIKNLNEIETEVLLLGGTMDQVAPLEETMEIHRELPNSKFAVFEAYHSLERPEPAHIARNELVDLFFKHGFNSKEFKNYFKEKGDKRNFVEFR
jgi:pimeloyl-ACP methyl ester carboxylesterase